MNGVSYHLLLFLFFYQLAVPEPQYYKVNGEEDILGKGTNWPSFGEMQFLNWNQPTETWGLIETN